MTDARDPIAEWSARDRDGAFVPTDHAAVDATESTRALVVELVRERAPHADLFHAFATLGRLYADQGASPTLAACALDGAIAAMPDAPFARDAAVARAARAAVAEGYVASRVEATRIEERARWEFPACGVPLEDAAVALAAGFPDDDDDALDAWAARVASAVARAGYRRATVAGNDRAARALCDALDLAGVKVRTTSPPAPLGRKSM